MEDLILQALKESTGWHDITPRPTGYVIRFRVEDRICIRGLTKDSDTFSLKQEEFKDVQICFLVEWNNAVVQYWTLGGRLHRIGGPAYVRYSPDIKYVERRFYFNGLQHDTNGPSTECYHGYDIDTDSFTSHVVESWDRAEFKWLLYGENKKRYGRYAVADQGQCYRRRRDRALECPEGFDITRWTDRLLIEWTGWLYDPNKDKDGINPHKLIFGDLEEVYEGGKLKKRTCSYLEGSWFHGSTLHSWNNSEEKRSPWLEAFNERVRKNLLSSIGIWEGPSYTDDEAEFYFLTEFNACYAK